MKSLTSLLYRLWYRAFPDTAYISLERALQSESKQFWVINTASIVKDEHIPENTEIVLGEYTVPTQGPATVTAGSRVVRVKIPATWLPEPLHAQVPADILLRHPNLRKLVNIGVVKIIRPSYARAILHSKAAKLEQKRLLNLREVVSTAYINRRVAS